MSDEVCGVLLRSDMNGMLMIRYSFSCGPLESAFEYDSLNQNASSYSYCPIFGNNEISIPKCSSCLQEMGNENYLANSTFPAIYHPAKLTFMNSGKRTISSM